MRSLLPLLAACAGPADTADSADAPFDPALAATLMDTCWPRMGLATAL